MIYYDLLFSSLDRSHWCFGIFSLRVSLYLVLVQEVEEELPLQQVVVVSQVVLLQQVVAEQVVRVARSRELLWCLLLRTERLLIE